MKLVCETEICRNTVTTYFDWAFPFDSDLDTDRLASDLERERDRDLDLEGSRDL